MFAPRTAIGNAVGRPSSAKVFHDVKPGVAAAVVLVAAFMFFLHGLTRGEASVLVPIAQMGFVVVAALGVFLLEESLTIRKISGLAVAAAALAVLATS